MLMMRASEMRCTDRAVSPPIQSRVPMLRAEAYSGMLGLAVCGVSSTPARDRPRTRGQSRTATCQSSGSFPSTVIAA